MKLKTKIFLSLFLLLLISILIVQSQRYQYPESEQIEKRLNYLQRVINQPLEQDSDIMLIGQESQEFMLFSYAFSSYAVTNLAVKDSSYKKQAVSLIKESIEKVLDNQLYSPYGIKQFDSTSDSSVLYLGHLNLMIGCYRLLSDDKSYNELNDNISLSLINRYNATEFINLESYDSSIWIPDNTVAMASIKLYSVNAKNDYDTLCNRWVQYVKTHYLEAKTGVLYSTINPYTGEALEEPRGSMLGWSIMFIYQFDSEFAIELYKNYKKHFSKNLLLFRVFKERYNNNETALGDIDSGPIFWGYSIPANEFALSNSILAKDFKTAKQLEHLINLGTKKIEKKNELKYNVRFVEMNISPMAEAMVLYSLTLTKWTDK